MTIKATNNTTSSAGFSRQMYDNANDVRFQKLVNKFKKNSEATFSRYGASDAPKFISEAEKIAADL